MNTPNDLQTQWSNSNVEKILADLRSEVATQKACITQYALQGLAFAGVMWGLALRKDLMGDGLGIYLCGSLVVFTLLVVLRMANHKYATVNRNLGYELHLHRIKDYARMGNMAWALKMLEVGWEEAMCAWRVVQPTLFEHPYEESRNPFQPHRARFGHRPEDQKYRWYDTRSLIGPEPGGDSAASGAVYQQPSAGASYHPGNYLRNVQWFLHAVAGLSIGLMLYFYYLQVAPHYNPTVPAIQGTAGGGVLNQVVVPMLMILGISMYWVTQWARHRSFRKLLESEFLSIQTCAVVWRVVVTCHILSSSFALRRHRSYKYYTRYTGGLALDFNRRFYCPHDWLRDWEDIVDCEAVYERLETMFPKADEEARERVAGGCDGAAAAP